MSAADIAGLAVLAFVPLWACFWFWVGVWAERVGR